MRKNIIVLSILMLAMVTGLFGVDYTIELSDSYGDGWNGCTLDVIVGGTVVLDDITIEDGTGPEVHTFAVTANDYIITEFTAGSYASETSYVIKDENGTEIASDGVDGSPTGLMIFQDSQNDLAAVSVAGNSTPSVDEAVTFTATVENITSSTIDTYNVKLMQVVADADDIELATAAGSSVDAGTTATVTLNYTFTTVADYDVYAMIDYTDDVYAGNNNSAPTTISVQDAGTIAITTFDGTFSEKNVPINLYYKSSLSEVIYMASELNIAGAMTGMTYYSTIASEEIPADRPINIWMGETTQTDLTGGWIPSTDLTQVFNGTLNFPQGDNAVSITFETPYVYAGGNLVVLVERPLDEEYYSSSDKFYGLETTDYENRGIRYYSDTTAGDPTNPPEGTIFNNVPKTTFFFAPGDLGSLAGNVSDANGALEGATVTLTGSMNTSTTTDASGNYNFAYIIPGDLNVTASLHGYENSTMDITVDENEDETQNFTLVALPMVNVAGTVSASDTATGVEGATVSLVGYENYETTTATDGTYTMSVYANQTYAMTVSFDGYQAHTEEVVVADADITVDVTVNEITSPVGNVEAVATETEATVSWNTPGSGAAMEFRYDDGVVNGQLGSQGGGDGVVLGSVFKNNAIVNEIKWYLTSEAAHTTVNLLIFGLDETGVPVTSDLLGQYNDIPNVDDEWNTYTLETPVEAPNGFAVVANTPGLFTALALDDGIEEPYAFELGTQVANLDYTDATSAWSELDGLGFPQNFLIRANGIDLGAIEYTRAPLANNARKEVINSALTFIPAERQDTNVYTRNSRALESYNVYRLMDGEQEDMTAWTEVATAITDTVYADTNYPTLAAGVYRYAVVALYTNNVMSAPAFSNILEKDMYSAVTVNVTTNSSDSAEGASIVLTNTEDAAYTYTMTAGTNGVTLFDTVYKGTYSIDVSFTGFDAYTATDLVFDEDTETVDVELLEMIVDPAGISHQNLENNEALITWSGSGAGDDLAENFDAETLPADWALVDQDGDGNNWEVSVNWGGMNESAHCMTSASYINNVGALTPNNWLISPQIQLGGTSELHFFVNGQDPSYAAEQFDVLVSTTDTNPASFTSVYNETISNADWHEVVVDLSAYAGQAAYIAWQHHDVTDMFAMNLDDVSVMNGTRVVYNNSFETRKEIKEFKTLTTTRNNDRSLVNYHVVLDGTEVATTTDSQYTLTSLVDGQSYTVGVFAEYTTGNSATVEYTFTYELVQYSAVTVNVTTNAGSAEGAVVTLTNTENTYTMNAPADGTVEFAEVFFGDYDVTVELAGFEAYAGTFTADNATETIDVALVETISVPGNVNHENLANGEARLYWTGTSGGAGEDLAENFDAETLPANWSLVDQDGDSNNWEVSVNWGGMNESAHCMTSASYINDVGALTPNNWLISPQIQLGASSELHFFVNAQDPSWAAEQFDVLVSTTDSNPASFTSIYNETISNADWHEVVVDLSAYAGQAAYIAWQHHDCTDMFSMNLDDISVVNGREVVYNNSFETQKEIDEFTTTRSFEHYQIFVDGTEFGTATDTEIVLNGLVNQTTYAIEVKAVYTSGTSDAATYSLFYDEVAGDAPVTTITALAGNYPNPFNPETTIRFSTKTPEKVSIEIYNVRGQRVKTLVNDEFEAGNHKIEWQGNDDNNQSVSSGVYFYRMKAGKYTSTKKMILLK